jgi:hypothetical protein
MFIDCTNLTAVTLLQLDNITGIHLGAEQMFFNCSSLYQINLDINVNEDSYIYWDSEESGAECRYTWL